MGKGADGGMPEKEPFSWPVSVVMVITVSTGRLTENTPSFTCVCVTQNETDGASYICFTSMGSAWWKYCDTSPLPYLKEETQQLSSVVCAWHCVCYTDRTLVAKYYTYQIPFQLESCCLVSHIVWWKLGSHTHWMVVSLHNTQLKIKTLTKWCISTMVSMMMEKSLVCVS